MSSEKAYLALLASILKEDSEGRNTRNGKVFSIFGPTLEVDLREGFPLLTTKRMFWKGIVEELLFFLRGDTDASKLATAGVHIWDGNTTPEFLASRGLPYEEGDMGPMYGWNWRFFGAAYEGKKISYKGKGFDQLAEVLQLLKEDPTSRRIMMTTFDPSKVKEAVLPPCHSLILQFYVKDGFLSACMYQRSADAFLGLPFNLASTSLLVFLIARLSGLLPGKILFHLGDTHIYEEHLEAVKKQLTREPYPFPQLGVIGPIPAEGTVEEKLSWLENLDFPRFDLRDYRYHPGIKAPLVV